MTGITGTSSFLIDAYNLIEEEKERNQSKILNKVVFLVEDEHGNLKEIKGREKMQNIIGQPPFYFR